MKKFYVFTQGCRINQYESQSLRESWLEKGLLETRHFDQADIFLINSCAVTERAVQELRKTVRKMHRSRPKAFIMVTGCATTHFAQQIQDLPGVTSIIPQAVKSGLGKSGPTPLEPPRDKQPPFTRNGFPDFRISSYTKARPVLKIQDGCSQACTFCIVPLTRGPTRSRHPEDILQEARRIADGGFRELVISGINLGQYQAGTNPSMDFWDLVLWLDRRLRDAYKDSLRLRLSSLDPGLLTEKGLRVLSEARLVCPHLHLSVQSACTTVLRSMGRTHYTCSSIRDFVFGMSSLWPTFGLGADFLVGFPGETRADFEDTLGFCQRLPFSYGHVFPYSPRPGTRARTFPGGLSQEVKKERSSLLRSLLAEKKHIFLQSLLELESLEVVLEQSNPARGVNEYYTTCLFEPGIRNPSQGASIRGRPIKTRKQQLVVRAQ